MEKTYDMEAYSEHLENELIRICSSNGTSAVTSAPAAENGTAPAMLLSSPDIDAHWQRLGGGYIADAMEQIRDYPAVSVAWAAYLGMAVAYGWDRDWPFCEAMPYQSYYGDKGFDDMDDHIMQDILGISPDSAESDSIRNLFRRCADTCISLIRHENIEPQSIAAYHIFVATCQEMYRIGAALELHRLGYKFEKLG